MAAESFNNLENGSVIDYLGTRRFSKAIGIADNISALLKDPSDRISLRNGIDYIQCNFACVSVAVPLVSFIELGMVLISPSVAYGNREDVRECGVLRIGQLD